MSNFSTPSVKNPDDVRWVTKKDYSNWVNPLIAFGWFAGFFLMYGFYFITQITISEIGINYLICGTISTLLPYKLILRWINIDFPHWIVANVVGLGPFISGLLLLLNFLFSSGPYSETYTIKEIPQLPRLVDGPTEIVFQNNELSDFSQFRTFQYYQVLGHTHVTYDFEEGLFGYPVLKETNLLRYQ